MFDLAMHTFWIVILSLIVLTYQQENAGFKITRGIEMKENSEWMSYRLIPGK